MNDDEKLMINKMIEQYNNFSRTVEGTWRKNTLFPLDQVGEDLASVLCLNRYEISQIQYNYLQIWSSDTEHPYMLAVNFFEKINVNYYDIFKYYFMIYQEQINMDSFFLFTMLFSFGVPDSLVRVLLSVCGIQTNYAVTFNQSVSFIRTLNGESHHDEMIKEWFAEHEKDDRIPIHQIVQLFSTSSVLLKPFREIKDALIKHFITEKIYYNIGKRRLYYNTYTPNSDLLFPPEQCFEKFMRENILKRPPPYFTEYRKLGEKETKSLDSLIIQVKIRYGYSRRFVSARNGYNNTKSTLSSYSINNEYDEGIRHISEMMKSGRNNSNSSEVNRHHQQDVIAGRKLSKEYVSKMSNDDHLKLLCSEASNHSLLIASRSKINTKIHPEFSVHFATD